MINKKKVSVIIPAYNEEDIIGETLEYLNQEWLDEIIIVNDGSSDKTIEIVKKYPVSIIDLPKNLGKGAAVTEGVRKSSGDIIVMIDADLGKSVVEIKKLVIPLMNSSYQLSIGILPISGGGLGLVRKLAEIGLKTITGKKMRAPLSGQRAFKREILEYILPLKEGFALEMGINIVICKKNINFTEVNCAFEHRVTGQNLVGYKHRLHQFTDILKYLWEMNKKNYV